MWSWILSKMFSLSTLANAISRHREVISVTVLTSSDLREMHSTWSEPARGIKSYEHNIH